MKHFRSMTFLFSLNSKEKAELLSDQRCTSQRILQILGITLAELIVFILINKFGGNRVSWNVIIHSWRKSDDWTMNSLQWTHQHIYKFIHITKIEEARIHRNSFQYKSLFLSYSLCVAASLRRTRDGISIQVCSTSIRMHSCVFVYDFFCCW